MSPESSRRGQTSRASRAAAARAPPGRSPAPSAALHVGPAPGVAEVGELVDAGVDERQRRAVVQLGAVDVEHDEHQPGPQPAGLRPGRGEDPRQLGRHQLDAGQVVGLDVGGAVGRLPAHDAAGDEAGDVARAQQAQVGALHRALLRPRAEQRDGRAEHRWRQRAAAVDRLDGLTERALRERAEGQVGHLTAPTPRRPSGRVPSPRPPGRARSCCRRRSRRRPSTRSTPPRPGSPGRR